MEVYFDNAATTRVLDCVSEIMVEVMTRDYGNPSSRHKKGMAAEQYVRQARERVAETLKAREKEIIFTSGGTEANNLALVGTALANQRRGRHIISTRIEHPAVYQPLGWLEHQGFEVTYLAVDENGQISLEELGQSIREDTILVSVMYVNNEVGSLLPITRIGSRIKEKNPRTLFHVDAIQAYGKTAICPRRQDIDLLSISGHKFHGPKGVGALYMKENTKINPILFGGGQQKDLRPGTENVPGIAGLGLAAMEAYRDAGQKTAALYGLRDYFLDRLEQVEGAVPNTKKSGDFAPHIVSAGFQGTKSEVLLHALAERGIYVSSGSACSSNHPAISGTLKAIGVKSALLDSTLRFSFGIFNTKAEVDYTIETLNQLLPVLRRYTKKR